MDTVTHNGVVYTKASIVARDLGYTRDYLGQLCRAKKIDGRMVGRVWYLSVSSLKSHKSNRYNTNSKKTVLDSSIKSSDTKISVARDASPIRQISAQTKISNFEKYLSRYKPSVYLSDSVDLLPSPKKNAVESKNEKREQIEPETKILIEIVTENSSVREFELDTTNKSERALTGVLQVNEIETDAQAEFDNFVSIPEPELQKLPSKYPLKRASAEPDILHNQVLTKKKSSENTQHIITKNVYYSQDKIADDVRFSVKSGKYQIVGGLVLGVFFSMMAMGLTWNYDLHEDSDASGYRFQLSRVISSL